jgi:hypothetical protein
VEGEDGDRHNFLGDLKHGIGEKYSQSLVVLVFVEEVVELCQLAQGNKQSRGRAVDGVEYLSD